MINQKIHIDESYVKKLYQEIFEHIQEIKQNPKSYIDHQNWAKKICEPKYKLIKNLTYLLEQNDINFKEKERILSILSYILLLNNNISNQITKNSTLDHIIIEFIYQYQKEFHKINIYGINVLSFVYHINNISSLINGIFVGILFNSLKIIEEQIVLENIVYMLIEINSLYKKIENNPFIDEYHINENSYLIIEIILQFLNKEKDSKKIIKILVCLKNIFDKEQKDILRSKDMESFIDISIRHLESDDDNALIIAFLNIFIRLTKYNTYYTIMYKTKELQDICDEFIKSNKVSQSVQFKCGKVLKNIVKHLKLNLFMKTNYHGLTLDQFDDDIDGVEEEEESEEDEGDEEQ
jgi:hypothetical protein